MTSDLYSWLLLLLLFLFLLFLSPKQAFNRHYAAHLEVILTWGHRHTDKWLIAWSLLGALGVNVHELVAKVTKVECVKSKFTLKMEVASVRVKWFKREDARKILLVVSTKILHEIHKLTYRHTREEQFFFHSLSLFIFLFFIFHLHSQHEVFTSVLFSSSPFVTELRRTLFLFFSLFFSTCFTNN